MKVVVLVVVGCLCSIIFLMWIHWMLIVRERRRIAVFVRRVGEKANLGTALDIIANAVEAGAHDL